MLATQHPTHACVLHTRVKMEEALLSNALSQSHVSDRDLAAMSYKETFGSVHMRTSSMDQLCHEA
jgi:hypothetical protein